MIRFGNDKEKFVLETITVNESTTNTNNASARESSRAATNGATSGNNPLSPIDERNQHGGLAAGSKSMHSEKINLHEQSYPNEAINNGNNKTHNTIPIPEIPFSNPLRAAPWASMQVPPRPTAPAPTHSSRNINGNDTDTRPGGSSWTISVAPNPNQDPNHNPVPLPPTQANGNDNDNDIDNDNVNDNSMFANEINVPLGGDGGPNHNHNHNINHPAEVWRSGDFSSNYGGVEGGFGAPPPQQQQQQQQQHSPLARSLPQQQQYQPQNQFQQQPQQAWGYNTSPQLQMQMQPPFQQQNQINPQQNPPSQIPTPKDTVDAESSIPSAPALPSGELPDLPDIKPLSPEDRLLVEAERIKTAKHMSDLNMLLAGAMSSEEVEFVFVDVEEGSESDEGESEALAGGGGKNQNQLSRNSSSRTSLRGRKGSSQMISKEKASEMKLEHDRNLVSRCLNVLEKHKVRGLSKAWNKWKVEVRAINMSRAEKGRLQKVEEEREEGEKVSEQRAKRASHNYHSETKRNETNIIPHNYIPPPA